MIEPSEPQADLVEDLEGAPSRAYRRLQRLELLHRLSSRIVARLEPEALFHEAVDAAHRGLGYTHVAVMLLDEAGQTLVARALAGYEVPPQAVRVPLTQGVTGWVATHAEPLLVPDVSQDARYIGMDPRIRSELAVPIRLGQRVLGVLNVESTEPGGFDSEDLFTLSILATQLAVAVENARLYAQTSRSLRETTALLKLARGLATVLEPERIFTLVLEALRESLPQPHQAVIHLLDEGSGELVPKYTSQYGTDVRRAMRLRLGYGLAGLAAAEGRTIYTPEVDAEANFVQSTTGERFRSLLTAPLLVDGQAIGAVSLTSTEPGAFDPEFHHLLTAVAAQAAVAIRNARLYRQERERAGILAGLMETVAYLNRERDLERLLERLVRRAAETFSVPAAAILTPDEDGRALRIRAAHGLSAAYVEHQRIPLSRIQDAVEEAVKSDGYWYTADITRQPFGDPDLVRRERLSSVLALPLIEEGALRGVLAIYSRHQPREFETLEIRLARTFADQASIALENAELIAQLEATRERLERFNAELEAKVEERTADLQEAQERLLRAEQLAAMGQFGAGIAHELRNPLGILSNSVFFLSRRLSKEEDPRLHRHLSLMTQEIQRSQQIIEDLLAFARTQRPQLEPTDLNELVRSSRDRCPPPQNVVVATQLEASIPVAADPNQLLQVIVNLVENAFQAMPSGGSLRLETADENGGSRLTIADTGQGISQEHLAQIFEPLFTTKTGGVGLGLAIVKHIVEAHRGRMQVESQPGRGTQFQLWLPRWSEEAPQASVSKTR